MTINELIKRYHITLESDGEHLRINKGDLVRKEKMVDTIRAKKAEIIAELTARKNAEEKAREERRAKIDAIEGIDEIRMAVEENARRWEIHRDSIDQGEILIGYDPIDVSALCKAYPRAAAYLKAEDFCDSENYGKSAAGRKAKERIINGEDIDTVISDMEAEWSAYCTEHMWD